MCICISNLYILLKSALPLELCHHCDDTILEGGHFWAKYMTLWPPPHWNPGYATGLTFCWTATKIFMIIPTSPYAVWHQMFVHTHVYEEKS